MRDTIIELIKETCQGKNIVGLENNLLESGVLTSLNIMTLIMKLNDEFDISIGPDKMTLDNFNSVDALVGLVEELEDN